MHHDPRDHLNLDHIINLLYFSYSDSPLSIFIWDCYWSFHRFRLLWLKTKMLHTILFVDDRPLHRWQVEFRVLRAWTAAHKETSWQGPYIVSWSNLISHSCCCNPTWPPWWWGSYHWRHGANLLPCPCLCSMIVGRWILAWFNEPNSMQVAGSLRWWFNIYYTIYKYI